MIHIGLFEGVGGFSIAAEWMGWETLCTCEINPFGQHILKYYWPNAYHHSDMHTLSYDTINIELTKRYGEGWRNDDIILTGGFPCQPYSLAGKRKGNEDNRHLWPEMLRAIREISPTFVVGENVYGLLNWNGGLVFEEVQSDLENEGYEVQPVSLPACGKNAPHKRERVWFVAYSGNKRCDNRRDNRQKRHIQGNERITKKSKSEWDRRECGFSEAGSITANPKSQGGVRLSERTKKTDTVNGKHGDNGATTHARLQRPEKRQQPTMGIEQLCEKRNATIPGNPGLQSSEQCCENEKRNITGKKSPTGSVKQSDCSRSWANFPTTQPTICSRNDGLSDRLDGITFPKWRNESIKAYGNAIVPQVALEIFKAIMKTESQLKNSEP